MEKSLRVECNFLRLALKLYLSKDDIATRLLAICKECPCGGCEYFPQECAGNPPTKVKDIIDEPL